MATIRDVARSAGVSTATVSYVINNGPRKVSAETRARVLAAMAELDFRPNASARNLASQRTHCLGVVLAGMSDSNFASAYFLGYIQGISRAAEMHGQNVMLFTNHEHITEQSFYADLARSRLVDGLVIIGSTVPDAAVLALQERAFPAVLLARSIPGHNVACVLQDYTQGTRAAVGHLITNGYCRIGLLGQSAQFSYAGERLAGYCQALAEARIPYDPALISSPPVARDDPSTAEVGSLLAVGLDALLTDRDVAVWDTLRRLSVAVPDDLALISLDESERAPFMEVPLTAVRPPKYELGMAAVELLLERIAEPGREPRTERLPMQLIVRGSSPPRLHQGPWPPAPSR